MSMLNRPNIISFSLGVLSGILVLYVGMTGYHIVRPAQTSATAGAGFQRNGGGGGGQNTARMAQRFGMTEADLQKELDSGKNIQQIAQEHDVQFGGKGGNVARQTRSVSARISDTDSGSIASIASSHTGAVPISSSTNGQSAATSTSRVQ